ncbi:ABC transporter permease [Paraherbaspirillum soli]|uniref:ABC transporter permease n=1 Tax=Paraherbaspirillum soli TaxID=631222 RepID=A0ABW0MAU1_9BURK
MTKRYRNAIVGAAITIFLVAGIGYSIGPAALHHYQADLIYYSGRHLSLVGWSMSLALVCGLAAGIVLSRQALAAHAEKWMQLFNIGNTIPSMAVLALALALFGIGDLPAIVALWLASLLPIVRNTYEGLKQVPAAMKEAAKGIGMTPQQLLFRVELPNALPVIVGGVRTALAINVGTAPLAILIGGESLGGLIFPGIYLNNQDQLLLGATATAVLALMLDAMVALGGNVYLNKRGLLR